MTASRVSALAQWVLGAVLVVLFGSGLGFFPWQLPLMGHVLVLLIAVPLLIPLVLLMHRASPTPPTRVARDEIDPKMRSEAEQRVYEVVAAEPGWRLVGWLAVPGGNALVASNGVSYLASLHAKTGPGQVIVASHVDDSLGVGVLLFPARRFGTLYGVDPYDLVLIDQPANLMLPLHRSQVGDRPITAVPDPITFIIDKSGADFVRVNSVPGRFIDVHGNGRYTLSGAVKGIGYFLAPRRVAAEQNKRSLALLPAPSP